VRRLLLAAYPEAWRRRYADEMAALIEDGPAGPAVTFDLLRGALLAHLRPLAGLRPVETARNSVGGVLGCFICFCFLGSVFAKTTEDTPFQLAGRAHPLIGDTHYAILIAAIVAVAALLLAAVPLAVCAIAQSLRTAHRELRRLVAVPPVAICAFAGSLGLLALWSRGHPHPGVVGYALLTTSGLVTVLAAVACWSASRALLRRIDVPPVVVRVATTAMAAVTGGMVVMSAATAVYLIAILADAPAMAASANGPGGIVSTAATIATALAGMLALSAMAALSARRGTRAAHAV
jgi:hypothetical protein